MPQLQIPVELVILHLAMLAFLEKHQVNYYRNFPPPYPLQCRVLAAPFELQSFCILVKCMGDVLFVECRSTVPFREEKGTLYLRKAE